MYKKFWKELKKIWRIQFIGKMILKKIGINLIIENNKIMIIY